MTDSTAQEVETIQPLWGAQAIADAMGVTKRRANYLLAGGHVTGARKMGGVWVITRKRLQECLEGDAD